MSVLKRIALGMSKRSIVLRRIIRDLVNSFRNLKFKINTLGKKVDNNVLIFCSFNGKSYSCSPKAIYEYIVSEPKYSTYIFVWSFREPEKYKFLEKN